MDSVTTSVATANDVEEVYEFMMEEFLPEPSLNAAINLQKEDVSQCYHGSRGRIVGFNLSAIVAYRQEEEWAYPTRLQLILDLLDALNKNKWALIPKDVDKLLYVEVICVAGQYKKQGNAQLFAKTGYRVLREIRLAEFLGKDGKPVFVCPDGTTAAQLVFRHI
ncbi:hypothetical protein PMAYCL1PPCAC_13593 [Pristionchus mayeri]|uniref:Uncharacterized protein n=1 Tax=Pristionchus mayeri TaxID=1317129 RepID=A0AAN5C9W4_9BILA|nr:hypothetical protein PMAYCL1PPCAC_13593 [Pristionchus mayeri]